MAFLATADATAAQAFYGSTLGLELLDDTPFALVYRCGPMELRIQKVPSVTRGTGTAFGWTVENLDAVLAILVARGVRPLFFPQMPQDDSGVWTAPGGARIVWFADPDGHVLSLTQPPAPP